MIEPVLNIRDLTVDYHQDAGWLNAVRDFSLRIESGQTYGLVGESGSGKTTVALAVMRYLPENGQVLEGAIALNGRDLLALDRAAMRPIWGAEMALVPQDPLSSLNPSLRVGEQLAEPLVHHAGLKPAEARRRAVELLQMVRVPDPARTARSYPHQISGGMQQRALIAMALSSEPSLLVLDEPTTALDVTTQAAMLDLIRDLIRERQTATLYVTHNLGVVAQLCDRVAVLYAGELVEDAPVGSLFRQPLHPYTQGLLASVPQLGTNKKSAPLDAIPGQIPPLGQRPPACIYADRCPLAIDICHEERPPLEEPLPGHYVRCHRWPEVMAGEVESRGAGERGSEREDSTPAPRHLRTPAPTLKVDDLEVHYPLPRSIADLLTGQPPKVVRAVDGVDLAVESGQTLGLVGESGSGKTSLARAVIGLVETSGGEMELLGMRLPPGLSERSRALMRHLQMVFQNPEEALNPYLTVGETLRRPLITLRGLSRQEAGEKVDELLAAVRLPAAYARRLPGQLSGGEKQRVAIARAFAAQPDLLVADEPVSSLDVSVQASILNLLNALQSERGNAILFIAHDLAVVGYVSDVIAVMYAGNLMEVASAEDLFAPPYHPYTEALLAAVPTLDPDAARQPAELEGDVPSQVTIPSGCPFHPRCPRFLGEICVNETPPWRTTETGKRYFCHIPIEELLEKQEQRET